MMPDQIGATWVVGHGHLKVLKWIKKRSGIVPDERYSADLAEKCGYTKMAKWIREQHKLLVILKDTDALEQLGFLLSLNL